VSDHNSNDKRPAHTNPSGMTSSHRAPHYDSIPSCFLRRMGLRFQLGDDTHGRGNRMKAYSDDGRYDIDALRDRYNHAMDHLIALREGTKMDDHIGAVAWFLAFAAEAEELGVDWKAVLATRTPENEIAYRKAACVQSERRFPTDPNRIHELAAQIINRDNLVGLGQPGWTDNLNRPDPDTAAPILHATTEDSGGGISIVGGGN